MGVERGRVFHPTELDRVARELSRALPRLPAGQRLIVASRHDGDGGVLNQMQRVTLMLWFDAAGINVVFGEMRMPISRGDSFEDDEWAYFPAISLQRALPDQELRPRPGFRLKTLPGRAGGTKNGQVTHKTWAIVDPQQLAVSTSARSTNP